MAMAVPSAKEELVEDDITLVGNGAFLDDLEAYKLN